MNIVLLRCEIELGEDRIVLSIAKDGKMYGVSRGWIAESADSDEFCAVADIRDMLTDIFKDISNEQKR